MRTSTAGGEGPQQCMGLAPGNQGPKEPPSPCSRFCAQVSRPNLSRRLVALSPLAPGPLFAPHNVLTMTVFVQSAYATFRPKPSVSVIWHARVTCLQSCASLRGLSLLLLQQCSALCRSNSAVLSAVPTVQCSLPLLHCCSYSTMLSGCAVSKPAFSTL